MDDQPNLWNAMIEQANNAATQSLLIQKELHEFVSGLNPKDLESLIALLTLIGYSSSPAVTATYWRGFAANTAWTRDGVNPWGEDVLSDDALSALTDEGYDES